MAEDEKAKHFTAIKFGKHKEVKAALDAGELKVSDTDSKGDTPIHVAARNGHKKIVKELLRQKADGTLKNASGKPAWQLALEYNFGELADYIREKHLLPPLTEAEKAGGGAPAAPPPEPEPEAGANQRAEEEQAEPLPDKPASAERSRDDGERDKEKKEKKHHRRRESREEDGEGRSSSRERRDETEEERRERRREREARKSRESVEAVAPASSPPRALPDAVPPPPPSEGASAAKPKSGWRDHVDFDFLIKTTTPLGTTIPLDAQFYREMERFKEALGEGQKISALEGIISKFWGRFSKLNSEGVEIGSNSRLQNELKSLTQKMDGDVDKLLDDVKRLDNKLKQANSDKEELASQLKNSVQELKGGEGRVADLAKQVEEVRRQLKEETSLKDDLQAKLDVGEREREEQVRASSRLQDDLHSASRELQAVKGHLTRVKKISVSFLPAPELEALFMRHDKDKSGEISAEEMKPLVEELCQIMEGKLAELREDVGREERRVEEAEREREREKERARQREEQLLGQIQKLEIDVRESEERERRQVHLMEERLEGTRKQHEARMEREREDREAEVRRVRAEGEQLLKRERERSEREAEDREKEARRERERLQAKIQGLQAELEAEKKAGKSITDRFHGAVKHLRAAQKTIERMEREAKASKAQSTIRMLGDFRGNLTEARKELRTIRGDVLSLSDKIRDEVTSTLEGISEWCAFILPLPFEKPDHVRTDALSKSQLSSGLKHMMGKYRYVSEECRKLNVELQNLRGGMRVFCRVRPLRQIEAEGGSSIYLRGAGLLSLMDKHADTKDFHFDQAYGPRSVQEQVFLEARPLMQTLIDGYNVSVFAYGPTGSGKTYTMAGESKAGSKHRGLTYRMIEDLFKTQKERAVLAEMQVSLSMFEIYNEVARDLLPTSAPAPDRDRNRDRDSHQDGLKILQDRKGHVTIEGLAEHVIESAQKAVALIDHGMAARAVGATNLNEHSSRSHLLIRVMTRSMDKKSGQRFVGKMYLVDLAGSENVGHSGAEGKALREAIGINKSLSALHDVMLALSSKQDHVPYRNSTLTKVLADSLGGQAKCLMYVMISPAMRERVNALAALKFASRCKDILLSPAKQNVDKDPLQELEEAKSAAEKHKQEAAHVHAQLAGQEGQLKLGREFLVESDRFEAKLRELFGLGSGEKKKKGQGAGKGGAQYLDKDSMALIGKRTHHDDLLARIQRGIEAFTLALREQDTQMGKLEAQNQELRSKVESYRAARDSKLRVSHDNSLISEHPAVPNAWQEGSQAPRGHSRTSRQSRHSRDMEGEGGGGSPSRRAPPPWDARTRLGGHASVRARVEARLEAARWWGPSAKAPFQALGKDTPNGPEGGDGDMYKGDRKGAGGHGAVVDKRAHSVPQVPPKPSFGRLPYIGGGLG